MFSKLFSPPYSLKNMTQVNALDLVLLNKCQALNNMHNKCLFGKSLPYSHVHTLSPFSSLCLLHVFIDFPDPLQHMHDMFREASNLISEGHSIF